MVAQIAESSFWSALLRLQICAVLDATLVAEDRAAQQDGTAGIRIEVLDESLPHRLRLSIAKQLQQVQRASKARGSGLAAVYEVCRLMPKHCHRQSHASMSRCRSTARATAH